MTHTHTDGTTSQLDTRLLKALSHPLRARILEALNERAASPSMLAEELGQPLANVSYHVKILRDFDAIELVETRPVRGAIEHVYRATMRAYIDDEHWALLPLSVRSQLFDRGLQGIWEHVVEAAKRGGFDDPRTHVSWTTFDLDREGYDDLADLLGQTLDRALEIQAEAAGRLSALAPEEQATERTELSILHYHRPRSGEPG